VQVSKGYDRAVYSVNDEAVYSRNERESDDGPE